MIRTITIKTLTLLMTLLTVQALFAQNQVDITKGLILKNEHVSFQFEPENMGLTSMKDLKSNQEHINSVNGKHLLWEVAFAKGRQIYTITNNYKSCSYASIEKLPNGTERAVLQWNRLRWWEEDDAVSVTVIIARWHVFYSMCFLNFCQLRNLTLDILIDIKVFFLYLIAEQF